MKRTRPRSHASSAAASTALSAPVDGSRPKLETQRRARSFAALALWWAVPAAAVLLLDVPICPWAGLLGWPCPGCGLTRAVLALLDGRFALAWRLHPLVYVVLPCAAGFAVKAIVDMTTRGRVADSGGEDRASHRRRERLVSVVAGVGLALVVGVWVARGFGAFGGPVPVETYAQWIERVFQKRRAPDRASPQPSASRVRLEADRGRK